MNFSRTRRAILIAAALPAAMVALAQPSPTQSVAGTQKQAEAIPSTRQALSGRLFFSREERERIDRAGSGDAEVAVDQVAIDPPAFGINGFVKRSDGETAVWVDGKASYRISSDNAARLRPQDVGNATGEIRILADSNRPRMLNARQNSARGRVPHRKKSASAQVRVKAPK